MTNLVARVWTRSYGLDMRTITQFQGRITSDDTDDELRAAIRAVAEAYIPRHETETQEYTVRVCENTGARTLVEMRALLAATGREVIVTVPPLGGGRTSARFAP